MAIETLPERIGPYQVVSLLGKGGMGAVYKAYKPPLRRYVAVKTIKAEFTTQTGALDRFRREAELASDLKHPNIVTVFDYEEVPDGDSYIVTELIEGYTLRDRMQEGPLSLAEISEILLQITSAMDYAYNRAHIVHRDIKPSNIFIEAGKRVALGDFGIAKDISSDKSLTAARLGLGTPDYISPEQALGQAIDRRSDIYSLGVVLFEMLTGTLPFDADTSVAIMISHIQQPVPELSFFRPDLPAAVQSVLNKAMAKQKSERYATATEMVQAFNRVLVPVIHASPPARDTQRVAPGLLSFLTAQLSQVEALERQGQHQAAYERLEDLSEQYPQEQEFTRRVQVYQLQGYVYGSKASLSAYERRFDANPPTITPFPLSSLPSLTGPQTGFNHNRSPLRLMVAVTVVLLAVAASLVFILLAVGSKNSGSNVTATAPALAGLPLATSSLPTSSVAAIISTITIAPRPPTAVASTPSSDDYAMALGQEGEALFSQSNYKEAAEKFAAVVALQPDVTRYQEYLARSHLNLRQYKELEEPARKLVQLEGNNPVYHYYLGTALLRTNRIAEAEKYFREAARLKPEDALYQRLFSASLWELGRYTEAEPLARKAIELNSGEPENHNALGRTLQSQARFPEAEKAFRTALSQNSTSAIYQYNLSLALNSQEKYREAEAEARKSISLDQNYAPPYFVLSSALRNQGKNDAALEAGRKGAELDPKDSVYPTQAALALFNLKRYQETETLARQATQLNSNSALAYNVLGDAFYVQGKFSEALAAYTAAVNNLNISHVYLTNQANAYARLNDFIKARDAYNRALGLKPDYKPALAGLEAIKNK